MTDADNIRRVQVYLEMGKPLPGGLSEWLRDYLAQVMYQQHHRDELLQQAIRQAPASTLPSRCQWVSDALGGSSDDPVIVQLQNWPTRVPTSIRRLKMIAGKNLSAPLTDAQYLKHG